MKLYVVTADTYDGGYGIEIELLMVSDNKDDRDKAVEYAKTQGWNPSVNEVVLNKLDRDLIDNYIE